MSQVSEWFTAPTHCKINLPRRGIDCKAPCLTQLNEQPLPPIKKLPLQKQIIGLPNVTASIVVYNQVNHKPTTFPLANRRNARRLIEPLRKSTTKAWTICDSCLRTGQPLLIRQLSARHTFGSWISAITIGPHEVTRPWLNMALRTENGMSPHIHTTGYSLQWVISDRYFGNRVQVRNHQPNLKTRLNGLFHTEQLPRHLTYLCTVQSFGEDRTRTSITGILFQKARSIPRGSIWFQEGVIMCWPFAWDDWWLDDCQGWQVVKRLQKLGVGGTVLKWFHSYLCNRAQKVTVGNRSSPSFNCTKGVPQGSVLSPFYLCFRPTRSCKTKQQHPPFADNMTRYHSDIWPVQASKSVSAAVSTLNNELIELGLPINIKKFAALCIHPSAPIRKVTPSTSTPPVL